MTINVSMSKDEFLEYNSFQEFKSKLNCGIMELEGLYNTLLKYSLEDGVWVEKNKYDKLYKEISKTIKGLKGGINDDNTRA